MGRHEKQVGAVLGVDRRESGYYSTPGFVADFIAHTLTRLNPRGRRVFDPCVGRGELVGPFLARGLAVDGSDILPFEPPTGVAFRCADFLDTYARAKRQSGQALDRAMPYDFFVANPPYNCHEVGQIRERKTDLGRLFGPVGVRNMYSMFISALIDLAKEGALLGLVTLDSFLTARTHRPLRDQILAECAVHLLVLCPAGLFRDQGADVRTCIMVLQKGRGHQGKVLTLDRPAGVSEFRRQLASEAFDRAPLSNLVLGGSRDHREVVVGVDSSIRSILDHPRLGDRFRCVTGISTGDDRRHLAKVKRPGFSVPFYKNPGSQRFFARPNAYLTDAFLELSERVPNFIVRNKPLLHRSGVTCSSMGVPFCAARLPARCAFGVNANIICDPRNAWWLIAYLNSDLVTYLVRGVLNRSNMVTSGYVSRIPAPPMKLVARNRLGELARQAYNDRRHGRDDVRRVCAINTLVARELDLSGDDQRRLRRFSVDLLRNV